VAATGALDRVGELTHVHAVKRLGLADRAAQRALVQRGRQVQERACR
jgi:hypothetical protein